MKSLSLSQMLSFNGGIDEEWCKSTATNRWIATGAFSLIACIPLIGTIIAAPSAITLWVIDGVCIEAQEKV